MAVYSKGKSEPVSVEVSEFAAQCLQLVDDVAAGGAEVIITKDGHPVSRLVPCEEAPHVEEGPNSMDFGAYRDKIRILGDIISPLDADWTAWEHEQAELFYKE